MSGPPPSSPPPDQGSPPPLVREIAVPLAAPRGLRRLGAAAGEREIRLRGAEMTLVHPGALQEPLTLPAGIVDVAVVDRGSADGEHGRFPVLHRMATGTVIPRDHGIEGWLWTTRGGSAYPLLSERADEVPNLALLFVKPLANEAVERCFRPEWVRALAERSPLGTPSVLGLLVAAERPAAAETAFREFGVLGDATDREVPPTNRRHLPGDKPANPSLTPVDSGRAGTSFAPPGLG
jgi:hypothetical protein